MPINITNVITRFGTYVETLNLSTLLCVVSLGLGGLLSSDDDNERMQQTVVTRRKMATDVAIPDRSAIVAD